MKIVVEKPFWDIFPDAKIGILYAEGITNKEEETLAKYGSMLRQAQENAWQYIENPEFAANPVIASWREAFRKFKTKKGVRCSIEALLKRIENGKGLGRISPLVDVYNSVSLDFGVPVGGEDVDKFEGTMRLTVAEGGEYFITLGSEESEPPYEGEVVYKDDGGAICRCWNWRESVRTQLNEDTKNAVFVIESCDELTAKNLPAALDELQARLEKVVGGTYTKAILTADSPEFEA